MKKELLFTALAMSSFALTAMAQNVRMENIAVSGFGKAAPAEISLYGTGSRHGGHNQNLLRRSKGNASSRTAYFKRPAGTLYLGWSNKGQAFGASYLSYPPFAHITFKNASAAPSETSWFQGSRQLGSPEVDADGNLNIQFGKNSITNEGLRAFYSPVLVNGTDSFSIGDAVANFSGDNGFGYSVFDWRQGYYYGNRGPAAAFGDASLGGTVKQVAWYQIFDKPVSSMLVNGLSFFVWCNGADFKTAGKDLKAYIYNVVTDENGEKSVGDSALAEFSLIPDSIELDEDWSSTVGAPGKKGSTYGIATLYPIGKDDFGGDMLQPVILSDEFAIMVTGFSGKNIGFYYGTAPDYYITGTETTGTGDNARTVNVYDDATPTSARFLAMDTTSRKLYDYYFYTPCYPVMFLHGYQDYTEFPTSVTFDDGTTSSFTEYNVPTQGGYAVSSLDNSTKIQLYTALPWQDGEGFENYKVDITYPDGEQPWINQHEDDATRKSSVTSGDWEQYGLQTLGLYGDALPEGKTGRHAYVTVSSLITDAGSNRIVIRQGDDNTTGISQNIKVARDNNSRIYNLAGQQVDAAYKGIVIRNGKKYIQK